jgi:hypothetical protein
MTGFTENITAGVIASVLTVLMLVILKEAWDFIFYRRFVGRYNVFLVGGKQEEGEVVELLYRWGRRMKVKSEKNGSVQWNSCIVMNSSNRFQGDGVYNYLGKDDFGIHTILISPDQNKISVYYRNLSHPDGKYGGVLWRKEGMAGVGCGDRRGPHL